MTREKVRLSLVGGATVMMATVSIRALKGWNRLLQTMIHRLWGLTSWTRLGPSLASLVAASAEVRPIQKRLLVE